MDGKISLAGFREAAAAQAALEDGRRREADEEEAERLRCGLESAPPVVAVLLNVARLSERFDEFPTSVPMKTEDGRNAGLTLERGEQWRLGGGLSAVSQVKRFGHPGGPRAGVAAGALRAMGVSPSIDALEQLAALCTWGPSLAELESQAADVVSTLPRWTVDGAIAMGSSLLGAALGLEFTPAHAYVWIRATLPATRDNLGRALVGAAMRGDVVFAEALLDLGADPNFEGDGIGATTVAGVAVANGHTLLLPLLAARGVNLRAADRDGRVLLHHVASCLEGPNPERAPTLFRELLALGLPPALPDRSGRTAAAEVKAVRRRLASCGRADYVRYADAALEILYEAEEKMTPPGSRRAR